MAQCDIANQSQSQLFPFNLARMNVRLNVNAQLSRRANSCRFRIRDSSDNGERKRPAFEGVAESGRMNERRGFRDRIEERDDIVVPAGFDVIRPLGPGLQL